MSLLKSIPYQFDDHKITESFRSRITPDMTDEAKASLQAEYTVALQAGRKAVEAEAEAVRQANTEAFLANPKAVIEEIEAIRMQGFSTGEKMMMHGIGTVSSKRHGKGFMVGKKTIGQHTVSQFVVTAKIGPHTRIDECGSSNDRHCKESMHAGVLGMLASDIASKTT